MIKKDKLIKIIKEERANHWNNSEEFDTEIDIVLTKILERIKND
jgi:hypothetical protein